MNNVWDNQELIKVLKSGGVAVMPTDTIYGVVCSASMPVSVEKVYELRKRKPEKPCIILIGDINEIGKFQVELNNKQENVLQEKWITVSGSRPISIVLDCPSDEFAYLHRGTKTLAFRLPRSRELREFLLKVGPIIAPSANIEGLPASMNINQAREYFGNGVDIYVDGGEIQSEASQVIKLDIEGNTTVLRA